MRAGRLQKRLESASAGLHRRADALACRRGEFEGRGPISQAIEVGRGERTQQRRMPSNPGHASIDSLPGHMDVWVCRHGSTKGQGPGVGRLKPGRSPTQPTAWIQEPLLTKRHRSITNIGGVNYGGQEHEMKSNLKQQPPI